MDKGIIAAPSMVYGNSTKFWTGEILSPSDTRYLIFYWDKVVIPTNDLFHIKLFAENALLATGAVTRPNVPYSGELTGQGMADAQILAQTIVAKDLIENDASVDWVIHQKGEQIVVPQNIAMDKRSIRVDLLNCLPVPPVSVSFEGILEFKERRKDELMQLHKAIDDLYLEVLVSPDPELKSKLAISQLHKSITELDAVANESWGSTVKFDLSAELNLDGKSIAAGAAAGAIFDFYTNMYTAPIGTLVGAAASLLKVNAKATKVFEPSKGKSVFGYLANAHDENILAK